MFQNNNPNSFWVSVTKNLFEILIDLRSYFPQFCIKSFKFCWDIQPKDGASDVANLVGIHAREDDMCSPFLRECIWCEELEEKD